MIESILNRLRGTGVIKHFGTFKGISIKLVWNHIYALYLAVLLGTIFSNVWLCISIFIAYLVGESKGWGKWVGALSNDTQYSEVVLQRCYNDKEGLSFPYIHQVSNFIIPEKVEGTLNERVAQYFRYCTLALVLRGMYWWGLVYTILYLFSIISALDLLLITVGLGLAFPVACYLGKRLDFNKSYGILHFSKGWENQEVIYGLFQSIALWSIILRYT